MLKLDPDTDECIFNMKSKSVVVNNKVVIFWTRNPSDSVLKIDPDIDVHIFRTKSKIDVRHEKVVIF